MAKRKDIEIKTRYATKKDCITNLRQKSTDDVINVDMDEEGKFKLNTSKGRAWMFEFIGRLEERKGSVYMVGDIRAKSLVNLMTFVSVIVCLAMAAFIAYLSINKISTIAGSPIRGGVVNIWMAPIWAIIPWINVLVLKYNDTLYKEVLNKVS